MNCGHCRHDNEADAKFCSECGAPLARSCGACGADQPPDSKFCNQCGTPMRVATPDREGPNFLQQPAAVRKNVTALFADLVGSTAFSEQVDPEAARAALAPYFDILRSTVEDRAGTVVKFLGDGVLALYGIPEVAEDDAHRAVATGIELQQRFATFADQIRDRHGVELGLRVGINSGELVIADDDADLVGDVLNTAARLEAECAPGRVLVGEDTWRLTRSTFGYEVLGQVQVKGKSEPVGSFQVVDDASTIEEATPFVGREEELHVLLDALEEARASSAAQLVTVIGAPGVGKTRLAQELRGTTEARSFDVRLERRGSTTFTPIADLLREVGDGSAEGVDRLLADHPEQARLVPILQSFLGHGQARSTEESFWATRRLFEYLTELYGPTIVVVDDIQWAEPRFWDLLDHLVEWARAPVLLVALARPELRDLRPELAQSGRRVAAAIALEGLDATATRELAARLLHTDDLPDELVERIPDTTEGNPLFVRELVQMLVDDGTLARIGERWRLTIDVDAVEVPPTVISLLATRVERLPDDERRLVELASVIGTEFDRGTLSAITPAGAMAGLGTVIDRLQRKDLLEPSGAWAGDHPVYRFHHVLVRDAAYRRLLKGRRADLHEAVGRHLEQLHAGGDDLDVTVAYHFEQVVRFRSELGAVDEATSQLAKVAAERLQRAAETALSREDLPSAGGYATRALELVAPDDPTRDELLVLACEALLSSGDVTGATPFVRELHERSSDDRLAAWADCFRAQRWSFTDAERLTEAAELTDRAARRLAELDDQAGVAKARLVRAGCLGRLGRVGDSEQELDLALGAARTAGDRRRTVAVLGAAPLAALWGPSPVARAGGRCLDVLRLLRITTASPAVEATSIRCQGMLEALRGRFDSAREKLDASRATAKELGLRHGLFETELFAGFVELWAGDPVAAEGHLRTAHEGFARLGLGADAAQAGALLARSLQRQDRLDEAEPLAQDAVDSAGQNLQTAMEARAILADIRSLQGRHDEARELVDDAVAIAERTDEVLDRALVLLAGARVAEAADDLERAERFRAAAERVLDDKGVTIRRTAAEAGDAGPGRQQPAAPLTNRAVRASQRAYAALLDGDRDRFIAAASGDFVVHNHAEFGHSVWAQIEMGRDELADLVADVIRDADRTTLEVLAIRGDDLCLTKSITTEDDHVRIYYHVSETEDGLVSRDDWFGPDQLTAAVDELDARWVGRGAPADLVEASRAYSTALTAVDDEVGALLADTFTATDHRGDVVQHRSADAWLQSQRSHDGTTTTGTGEVVVLIEEYVAHDTGRLLVRVRMIAPGGEDETRQCALVAHDHGKITGVELFDAEQVAMARRRYDELGRASSTTLSNRAIRLTISGVEAMERGDRDAARAVMAEDFVLELRLRIATEERVDRDRFIEIIVAMGEQGFPLTLEPLAVRDDDLALFRNRMVAVEGTTERVLLVESNGQSLTSIVSYDPDLLPTALSELDDRWVARGGPRQLVEQTRAFTETFTSTEGLHDLVHADAVIADHRSAEVTMQNADEWLATTRWQMQAGTSLTDGLDIVIEEHVRHEHDPIRSVHRVRMIPRNGDPAWRECVLLAGDDDGIDRIELFGADDLDLALRRYDELEAHDTPGRLDEAPTRFDERGRSPERVAPRVARQLHHPLEHLADRFTAHFFDSSFDGIRHEIFEPDFAREDRRASVSFPTVDLDGFREAALALDAGPPTIRRGPVVAVRSNAYLGTAETVYADGATNSQLVVVVGGASDRIARIVVFDPVQLRDALDELDRVWVESGGSARLAELGVATRRAMSEANADEFPLADDFVIDDHRAFGGLGRRSRSEFIATFDLLTPSDIVIRQIFEITDDLALYEFTITRRTDGFVWHGLHVLRFGEHGFDEAHLFDPDQFAEARALYDELASGRSEPTRSMTNTAWQLSRRFMELMQDGDLDGVRSLLAAEYVFRDHEPVVSFDTVHANDVPRQLGAYMDGAVVTSFDLLAIRGDDLCLERLRTNEGDWRTEVYFVIRSEDGLLRSADAYGADQLMDAQRELYRRWAESGGPASIIDADQRFIDLMRSGTYDDMRDYISDDFESVDHRPLGMGRRERDTWLESVRDFVGSAESLCSEYLATDGTARLFRGQLWTADGELVLDGISLSMQDAEGRLCRFELFDHDQLDVARARFDELVGRGAHRSGATNRAARVARTAIESVLRDSVDQHRGLFASDFATIDQRRSDLEARRDGTRHDQEFWRHLQGRTLVDVTDVAARGESLCLQTWLTTDAAGDEIEQLQLTEIDSHDRMVAWVTYDPDQLMAAQLDMDRRWFAAMGLPTDDRGMRLVGAMYSTDPDEMFALSHPDIAFADHRLITYQDGGLDEYAASLPSLDLVDHVVVPVIHRISQHGVVFERAEFGKAGETSTHVVVVGVADGLARSIDSYEVDDLQSAFARLDEVNAERSAAAATVTDRATEPPDRSDAAIRPATRADGDDTAASDLR